MIVLFVVMFLSLFITNSLGRKNIACAATFTNFTCPASKASVVGPVTSIDLKLTITTTGITTMSPDARISLNVVDDPQQGSAVCDPHVHCLLRTVSHTITWKAPLTSYTFSYDDNGKPDPNTAIGCSSGKCDDVITVTATSTDPVCKASPIVITGTSHANGTTVERNIVFECNPITASFDNTTALTGTVGHAIGFPKATIKDNDSSAGKGNIQGAFVYVEKNDGSSAANWGCPTSDIVATKWCKFGGVWFNTGTSTNPLSLSSNLWTPKNTGTYYAAIVAYDTVSPDHSQCSGDPLVTRWPAFGYTYCGTGSSLLITVNPSSTPTPTPTISVTPSLPPSSTPTPFVTPTPTEAPVSYSISGTMYIDANTNGIQDNGETEYNGILPANSVTISPASGVITYPTNGVYSISGLKENQAYTVTFAFIPRGYQITYPQGSPQPLYQNIFLGTGLGGCNATAIIPHMNQTGQPLNAQCTVGNLINLNFGITNASPWIQGVCTDMRDDNGFTNRVPVCPDTNTIISDASICTTPDAYAGVGIAFTGTTASFDFGQGQASEKKWQAQESFKTSGHTTALSYSYLYDKQKSSNISQRALPDECTLTEGCSIDESFVNGLYTSGVSTYNVYIKESPGVSCKNEAGTNGSCIFLVKGNLYIKGNITVPVGTTLTFSVGGSIFIDKSVTRLDGFYVSEKNITVEGNETCASPDAPLSFHGSTIANALNAMDANRGNFINKRNLCTAANLCTPTVTFFARPDMLLFAPDLLRSKNTIWQEVAP